MTLKEYAQSIGHALADAHNNKNMVALTATFKEADKTLEDNHISPASRKEFWEEVDKVVHSAPLRLEKQSNSALIVLIQTIEREIAARKGKSK